MADNAESQEDSAPQPEAIDPRVGHRRDSVDSARWQRRRKHIFVLSFAGKPVYTRYGDENVLSSLFGVIQAIVGRTDEALRVVHSGEHTMVFFVRSPLYYVAVSRTGEPVSYLRRQLEYLHGHIIFHVTASALGDIFRRNASYDLRPLLGGTELEVNGLVQSANYSPAMMLSAVPSLRLRPETRSSATDVLLGAKHPDLLYAILVAGGRLVTLVNPKRHPLCVMDALLILNFVENTHQLRSQETWTPMCLPGFNDTGFLHAYAAYISPSVCLLLVTCEATLEVFHYCSNARLRVAGQLSMLGALDEIEAAVAAPAPTPADYQCRSVESSDRDAVPRVEAMHVVYKSLKYNQYFESCISERCSAFHACKEGTKALLRRYVSMHDIVHRGEHECHQLFGRSTSAVADDGENEIGISDGTHGGVVGTSTLSSAHASGGHASSGSKEVAGLRSFWDAGESESVLCRKVREKHGFELYAAFPALTQASDASLCCERFAAWVKQHRADLFMQHPSTW